MEKFGWNCIYSIKLVSVLKHKYALWMFCSVGFCVCKRSSYIKHAFGNDKMQSRLPVNKLYFLRHAATSALTLSLSFPLKTDEGNK